MTHRDHSDRLLIVTIVTILTITQQLPQCLTDTQYICTSAKPMPSFDKTLDNTYSEGRVTVL
jgi:hypothetical protein